MPTASMLGPAIGSNMRGSAGAQQAGGESICSDRVTVAAAGTG